MSDGIHQCPLLEPVAALSEQQFWRSAGRDGAQIWVLRLSESPSWDKVERLRGWRQEHSGTALICILPDEAPLASVDWAELAYYVLVPPVSVAMLRCRLLWVAGRVDRPEGFIPERRPQGWELWQSCGEYPGCPLGRKPAWARRQEVAIAQWLARVGIPPHFRGFLYLQRSIALAQRYPSLLNSLTGELYPAVARFFGITSSQVERSIRHAIEEAWVSGDFQLQEGLFGGSVDLRRGKPTNRLFIARLVEQTRLQGEPDS